MKVYRLEKKGIGPFINRDAVRYSNNRKKTSKANHIMKQATDVCVEVYIARHTKAVEKNYVFGAPTKELLRAYFGCNLRQHFKKGYRIKSYEVPSSQVLNMGHELAFPVKYHKLRTVERLEEARL